MSFRLPAFHEQAVSTPSHEDVTAMRDLLVETLASAGVDPEIDEAGNVLAHRGTGDQLVLNTHIDTVPPHVPYEREGDLVRGRGACDAKGPLAAFVDAFLHAEIDGRLTLAVTTNEETTQTGGAHLGETLDADGYIVGEPTDLDVCIAARGQFEGEVRIRGESGHASDPANGENAIRTAAPILQALESYDETRGPGAHDLLGRPTLTPSVIEGGEAINQIPGECTIQFDRRTVPPETVEEFFADLREHLDGWLTDGYDLEVGLIRPDMPAPEAFATDSDASLVEALATASGGQRRPFGAATEASYFADDAPVVVFGPGVLADEEGPVAHADREYVRLSDVEAAAEAVRTAVEQLL
ncbi:M20/M25/M40 family metallo-hydrolase [Halovenus sp. WSH3]|uniref:M20/M25/M40 family metallo-hydrolase n=1 Tax=Halovenus carboxidivorans TaxID=2692199 RepID=A0A6B0T9Y6_9EURY|nr:M20 family metallopeptidase [Halovenus carboxidivorans]MXR51690.1 M20/M25/M40 family metallo-hydrolase [Halovenus carboxidivorans]